MNNKHNANTMYDKLDIIMESHAGAGIQPF